MAERHRVVVIGGGPGGMCMAIKLAQAGITEVVVLEKAAGVGGTWWHNRYPGAECDVPSHLYSFSFEPKADWSKPYAPQPEILEYMTSIAVKYKLLPPEGPIRFEQEVESAVWDEVRSVWVLRLAGGDSMEAEVVVSAVGMFCDLAMPDIDGLVRISPVSPHPAHSYPLRASLLPTCPSARLLRSAAAGVLP